MSDLNESTEIKTTNSRRQRVFLAIALTGFGLLLLTGCLLAKRYVLGAAVASGMGTPQSSLPGMFFTGLAFSAPLQSAVLLAFLPFSWTRRIAIACTWMLIAVLVFQLGNQAMSMHDSPSLFRSTTTCVLPSVALGWLLPLGLIRTNRGWRLSFPAMSNSQIDNGVTTASLFALTLLVSLCLFSLQFGPAGSYRLGLIGCVIGMVMGAASILPIYWIMKSGPVIAVVIFVALAIAVFWGARTIMLLIGAGNLAVPNSIFLTTIVMSSVFGILLARLCGIRLSTNQGKTNARPCPTQPTPNGISV